MFIKLFKYDFKAVFFKLIPFIILVFVFAILVRLVNLITIAASSQVIFELMTGLVNMFFVFALGILFVYAEVLTIMRYAKSLFKDQGYLTHTLPVSKHKLLLSQILVAMIVFIITALIVFLAVVIAYFSSNMFRGFFEFVAEFFEKVYTGNMIVTIILFILLLPVSMIQSMIVIYLGIALGHAHATHKSLLSLIYCIVISNVLQFIVGTLIFVFLLFFTPAYAEVSINLMLGMILLMLTVITVASYFLTIFTMKRRLNLE